MKLWSSSYDQFFVSDCVGYPKRRRKRRRDLFPLPEGPKSLTDQRKMRIYCPSHRFLFADLSCVRMHFHKIRSVCLAAFSQYVGSISCQDQWQQQMLAFCLLHMLCETAMSNSLYCGLLSLNCELQVYQYTAVFCDSTRFLQFFIHIFYQAT